MRDRGGGWQVRLLGVAPLRVRKQSAPLLPVVVNRLAQAVNPDEPLDVVVYGSVLEPAVDARDVDVWASGSAGAVERWQQRASDAFTGLEVDVASPQLLSGRPRHEAAVRWWASQGVAVCGRLPPTPPAIAYPDVCAIFRASAHATAVALVTQAQALKLAGQPTAGGVAQVAARAWLRARAWGPEQSRAVRRLSDRELARALYRRAPQTRRALQAGLWQESVVLNALGDFVALDSSSLAGAWTG